MELVRTVVTIRSAESDFECFADLAGQRVHFGGRPLWWEKGWIVCEASDEFVEEYCLYAPKELRIDKKIFCYSPHLGKLLMGYIRCRIPEGRYVTYIQFAKPLPKDGT